MVCVSAQDFRADLPEVDDGSGANRTGRVGHPVFAADTSDDSQRGKETAGRLGGRPPRSQKVRGIMTVGF